MKRVLVTDGNERSALAAVRSLGRAGCEVYVAGSISPLLAGASRHSVEVARVPSSVHQPGLFSKVVEDLIVDWNIDLVLPMTEASMHSLLRARDELLDARVPFPDYEIFKAVCDKDLVLRVAESCGIAVPQQVRVRERGERPESLRSMNFPAVIKPSRSIVPTETGYYETSVSHVLGPAALDHALEKLPEVAFPVLVQERIVGSGTGVFLLLWNGNIIASFSHRRIREKPPSGGVSVVRESVPLADDLLFSSRKLLDKFGWHGVAMVEYKRETETGVPYLMEVNGRFWGSLQLAVDAGVDFPRLLVEAASGLCPRPVTDYQTGIRSRWLLGDLDHLLLRLTRSRHNLSLPNRAPGRLQTVVDFLKSFGPGSKNEVVRMNDLKPAVREAMSWLGDVIGIRS